MQCYHISYQESQHSSPRLILNNYKCLLKHYSYLAAEAVESLAGGDTGSDNDQDFDDHDSAEEKRLAARD